MFLDNWIKTNRLVSAASTLILKKMKKLRISSLMIVLHSVSSLVTRYVYLGHISCITDNWKVCDEFISDDAAPKRILLFHLFNTLKLLSILQHKKDEKMKKKINKMIMSKSVKKFYFNLSYLYSQNVKFSMGKSKNYNPSVFLNFQFQNKKRTIERRRMSIAKVQSKKGHRFETSQENRS